MLFRRHPDGLCPACRLFGTTSYKSRVRFGFGVLNGTPEWLNNGTPITLPLLEKPRPTWSMPNEESKVPGRKFYVHHHGWKKIIEKSCSEPKTENNRTVEAVKEGSIFTFEVFFENLEPWELGLLIYSLELEPALAHKMGMGKALGFGSVKIEIEDISVRMEPCVWQNAIHCKNEWLTIGIIKQLGEWFDGELETQHIMKLRSLLKWEGIKEDIKVQYPKLEAKDDPEKWDGYKELKDKWGGDRNVLLTPWSAWNGAEETQTE